MQKFLDFTHVLFKDFMMYKTNMTLIPTIKTSLNMTIQHNKLVLPT